jgi:hypothetical protein
MHAMITNGKPNAATVADEIRHMLKIGGSEKHAQTARRFFKEEIESYGWRTGVEPQCANGVKSSNSLTSSSSCKSRTIYSTAI